MIQLTVKGRDFAEVKENLLELANQISAITPIDKNQGAFNFAGEAEEETSTIDVGAMKKDLEEKTTTTKKRASKKTTEPKGQTSPETTANVSAPVQNTAPTMPTPASHTHVGATSIPVTSTKHTRDQMIKALHGYVDTHGMDAVIKLAAKYGAESVSAIPDDKIDAIMGEIIGQPVAAQAPEQTKSFFA